MIFEHRQRFTPNLRCTEEAMSFDRYLASRARYKKVFLDRVAELADSGSMLEVGHGYGSLGLELLQRTSGPLLCLASNRHARRLLERRLAARRLIGRCRVWVAAVDAPSRAEAPLANRFRAVYSVNCLHEWDDPAYRLQRLLALVEPGGTLLVNDLRRDANPFITEYLLRDMAAVDSDEGRRHLQIFLRSLRSAYTADELDRQLRSAGVPGFRFEEDGPMTLTLRIDKGAT